MHTSIKCEMNKGNLGQSSIFSESTSQINTSIKNNNANVKAIQQG